MFVEPNEIEEIRRILKTKNLTIATEKIRSGLERIEHSQEVFPMPQQKALLVQLLNTYESTRKKVVILLESSGEEAPVTVTLGALAEDWPGMSNSILGIIHKKDKNVLFIKGFTVSYEVRTIGIVILTFVIEDAADVALFQEQRKDLLGKIREVAEGSGGKQIFLEDETVKYEIYNALINHIKRVYKDPDIEALIGKTGEALKFCSSRSREYLEERKISDLARLVLINYKFQKAIREKQAESLIDVSNFETLYERLTGITLACRSYNFSIEDFLRTLEFIVPGHILKHHRSFVTTDGILVYRIEFVTGSGNPVPPAVIKSITASLEKQIATSQGGNMCQIRSVGGFEHYARAIIPFLMEELQRTELTQVFFNVSSKTEFLIQIKLIIVAQSGCRNCLKKLISLLDLTPGTDVVSVIPPKHYRNNIEVNIFNLRIQLAWFPSISAIFASLRETVKKVYGAIRDFDEGLRMIDLNALNELNQRLAEVNPLLIHEVFFNLDELYRVETPVDILGAIIQLCHETIHYVGGPECPPGKIVINHRNIRHQEREIYLKTVFVIAYDRERKILSSMLQLLEGIDVYFTKIEWEQRLYLLLILKKNGQALAAAEVQSLLSDVVRKKLKNAVVMNGAGG